jgi:hypothetical protein
MSTGSGPFDNAPEDQSAMVVEHIQDCGWVDDTADQSDEALVTLDLLIKEMLAHRDILKMDFES